VHYEEEIIVQSAGVAQHGDPPFIHDWTLVNGQRAIRKRGKRCFQPSAKEIGIRFYGRIIWRG
jgi:hypothetical protein